MSSDLSSNPLLPCPFCGCESRIGGEHNYGFYVACIDVSCYCAVGEGYDRDAMPSHAFRTEEDAIEAWNKRVPG